MMDIAEALIRNAANEVCDSLHITFNGTAIDLESPFRRLTMIDAVKEYSGVDFKEFMSDNESLTYCSTDHRRRTACCSRISGITYRSRSSA